MTCQNGDVLAEEQITAEAKEKVIDALGSAAAKLRRELGESLASIQKYDVPLEQATTVNTNFRRSRHSILSCWYECPLQGLTPLLLHRVRD